MRSHTFNNQFRQLAVDLANKTSVAEAAATLGCSCQSVYKWCQNARLGEANLAVTNPTRRELLVLRKENARLNNLEQENAELKSKLAAIMVLAKNTDLNV